MAADIAQDLRSLAWPDRFFTQGLIARGAYTESDKPPARKIGLATQD